MHLIALVLVGWGLGLAEAAADPVRPGGAEPAGAPRSDPKAPFEGVLRRTGTVGAQKTEHVLYVRENGDLRQDNLERGQVETSLLRKRGEKWVVVLSHREKRASRLPLPELPPAGTPAAAVRIDSLGIEKVAGVDADHLRVTRGAGSPIELWVTRFIPVDDAELTAADALLMPDIAQGKQPNEADVASLRAALRSRGVTGFVLNMIMAAASGSPGTRITRQVTSIQPKHLPASLFEIPKRYVVTGDGMTP